MSDITEKVQLKALIELLSTQLKLLNDLILDIKNEREQLFDIGRDLRNLMKEFNIILQREKEAGAEG